MVDVCDREQTPLARSPTPLRRRPDITVAATELGWALVVPIRDGLARTGRWLAGQGLLRPARRG